MIEISFQEDSITMNGHAHYAEPGKDIVCAAISALMFTLIDSIETLTDDELEYVVMKPGAIHIKHGNLSESAKLLIDSFFIGVQLIIEKHPDCVKIV